MVVADALVKRAWVSLVLAEAVTPGKYVLLFSGEVAHVEESLAEGVAVAGPLLMDKLWLPLAATGLMQALEGLFRPHQGESVGIVETHTVAAALLAADKALKTTDVWLKRLHLAQGIGGKGYFTVTGALHEVEASLEAAAGAIAPHLLVSTELIQRPHPEVRGLFF